MAAFEFSKAIGFIADIGKTAKRLSDTREEVKVNEVSIQLQGIVLDLQSEMMMIQSNYQEVLRSREELEKKLVQYENWEKEKARYFLKSVSTANFVYALKPEHQAGEPKHWLCANCYNTGQKSILQQIRYPLGMQCPICKTNIHPETWEM